MLYTAYGNLLQLPRKFAAIAKLSCVKFL